MKTQLSFTQNPGQCQKFRWFFLLATPIIFWHFYNYIGLDERLVKLTLFLYVPLLFLYVGKNIFLIKYSIRSNTFWIKYFILLIVFSSFNSLIFWEQSLVFTYRVMATSFLYLYYFILLKYNIESDKIIKIILIFFIIYSLLYILALSLLPKNIFARIDSDVSDARGFYRILLISFEFVIILFYYSIYRIKYISHNKLLWIILLCLSYVFIVLSLSRSVIVITTLIGMAYFIWRKNLAKNILRILLIVTSIILFRNSILSSLENSIIGSALIVQFKKDIGSNNNEVNEAALRIVEFRTAFNDYKQNSMLTILFGNGRAHAHSSFGQYESSLHNFNRSDSQLPSIYITHGLFGILLLLILTLKCIFQKVSSQLIPFKLFIVSAFLFGFFAESYIYYGIGLCISYFVLEQENIKKRNLSATFQNSLIKK